MVVIESASNDVAGLLPVHGADHEQVIRVEYKRKVIAVAALDLGACPQPERHEAVAVVGRGLELDDFVVGREAESPGILGELEQDQPAMDRRFRHHGGLRCRSLGVPSGRIARGRRAGLR